MQLVLAFRVLDLREAHPALGPTSVDQLLRLSTVRLIMLPKASVKDKYISSAWRLLQALDMLGRCKDAALAHMATQSSILQNVIITGENVRPCAASTGSSSAFKVQVLAVLCHCQISRLSFLEFSGRQPWDDRLHIWEDVAFVLVTFKQAPKIHEHAVSSVLLKNCCLASPLLLIA